MNCNISVIIPLYNKEKEIGRAIASAIAQSMLPLEIIVVDDGSTDRSAEVAASVGSPLVRLIRQENHGVSAARNRAIAEARGEYVALLDGDDAWKEGYLAQICRMIEKYPHCGAYSTAFDIECNGRTTSANTPKTEGIVDFFAESMHRYVLIPSAATLRRDLVLSLGGFPEGMKLGEDQYLWTKIARAANVCFSPERLAIYSKSAQNRSAAIYTPEQSIHSLEELYDAEASEMSNEYVARIALGKALVISTKGGGTAEAARTVRFFAWTKFNRRTLRKVKVINSLPLRWRAPLLAAYNALAWMIMKKGL